jgi:hypothetical protein
MAKGNAIYAPGELSRVREKLGVSDVAEAKRMAELLGGEVGTEKSLEPDPIRNRTKRDAGDMAGGKGGRRGGRRVDTAEGGESGGRVKARPDFYPGDDPTVPARLNYRERVKIDQYAGQLTFEIKSSFQVLASIFSFFKEPVDYVNPRFINKRLNEYYGKIERLVTSARNLFPKNNAKRNHQLKRASPFVFKILDVMRTWNIEQLASNIAELQSHPRSVKVSDFADVLRDIYKPLFILADMNTENMKSAFKLIYKVLYIESPMEAKDKYQAVIRNIITALVEIRRDVHHGMYPMLMKLISDRFLPYERFFIERRRRYMAFLNVTESAQLNSADLSPQQIENMDVEALQQNLNEEDDENEEENAEGKEAKGEGEEAVQEEVEEEEDPNDPKVIERKAKQEAEKMERRALDQGQSALEALFPKAGWEKLGEFPDLYPYFANVYNLKHGYELISPTDPLQQVSVMMNIMDDLFIGMRYLNFGSIIGPDGRLIKVSEEMGEIINNWRQYIEDSFSKEYLPRLNEYCRILENSQESRISVYAKKTLNELQWVKRLYFLPYYKFEALGPPPFQKQDVVPIYSQVRKVRKCLTSIAVGIEQGTRAGGAATKAPCDGINNPWENYNFQVPNPISKRMDALLPPERKINATLIFFSLSAAAVLDYIVNNENSWAYSNRPGPLFRSVRNEGISPIFGVDEKLDADKIFRDSLKKG